MSEDFIRHPLGTSIDGDPDENPTDDARDDARQTSDEARAEAEGISVDLYREMKSKGWR